MGDIVEMTDGEVDVLLLSLALPYWQKVAMIIARAIIAEKRLDENKAGERVEALVQAGKLESAGNVQLWRFSEVRLPPSDKEFTP